MSLRDGKIKVGTVVYKAASIKVKGPSGCCTIVGKAIIELVTLEEGLIPTKHRRGSYLDWEDGYRKCRVPKAYVRKITKRYIPRHIIIPDGWTVHVLARNNLEYIEGEIVVPDSFDTDPKNICTNGIHVFLDRDSAERWIDWDYTV